jgi:hypothetical protein
MDIDSDIKNLKIRIPPIQITKPKKKITLFTLLCCCFYQEEDNYDDGE